MPKVSICIPFYHNEATYPETLLSVNNQTFNDYEVVTVYNKPLSEALDELVNKATTDILVFLAADDILLPHALQDIYDKFNENEKLGILARPYYWFKGNWKYAVRKTKQSNFDMKDLVFLTGQMSGMALRKSMIKHKFQSDKFVEFASVALFMIKETDSDILDKPNVAVRIDSSDSKKKYVYEKSPFNNWCNVICQVFAPNMELIDYLICELSQNYIGMVQVKKYGGQKALLREWFEMLRNRPSNLISLKCWSYFIFLLIMPSFLLCSLTDLMWSFKKEKMV